MYFISRIISPKDKDKKIFTTGVLSTSTRKPLSNKSSCSCYGKARTCSICLSLKNQYASRAGTPGYRPPEVLLKSQEQSTAVDVWACGVIMLNILSGRSNFFSSPDDVTALAEMVSILRKFI